MNDPAYEFLCALKKLDGAIEYDGNASVQVVFKLTNGKTLRIGITDEDVAIDHSSTLGLWCDQYEGLPIKGSGPELITPATCKASGCKTCDGSCMHD